LEQLALRRLIFVRLLLQEASRRELNLADAELQEMRAALERRTETLAGKVVAALVKDARLGEGEVEAYYVAHSAEFRVPAAAHLQMIAVADKAAAAQIVAALTEKDDDFATLAKERSQGFRAAQGGDLGWVPTERLRPAVRMAVAGMKPGEVRGPVETESGVLVLKLLEARPERVESLPETQPAIEQHLLREKRGELVTAWLAEREKASKIERLR
jgi:parvulin-like peptidyl-prolyl isomerase